MNGGQVRRASVTLRVLARRRSAGGYPLKSSSRTWGSAKGARGVIKYSLEQRGGRSWIEGH